MSNAPVYITHNEDFRHPLNICENISEYVNTEIANHMWHKIYMHVFHKASVAVHRGPFHNIEIALARPVSTAIATITNALYDTNSHEK